MSARLGGFDMSCLYSTVVNETGVTRSFGFLPPHGATLDADEQYTVFGHIAEAISRGEHATDRRYHQALVNALDRGDISILATPLPIILDAGNGESKMQHLNNGTLSLVDPCWLSSDSDEILAA